MKLKLFEVIIDDGKNIFKVLETAKTKKELKEKIKGNGDIIKIKDVSNETALTNGDDFYNFLEETLVLRNYGEKEKMLILAIIKENEK